MSLNLKNTPSEGFTDEDVFAHISGFFAQAKGVASATCLVLEMDEAEFPEGTDVPLSMATATLRAIEDAEVAFDGHWMLSPWNREAVLETALQKIIALCFTDGPMSDIENLAKVALAHSENAAWEAQK